MNRAVSRSLALTPLEEPVQRSEVVHNALLETIMRGELASGTQLNADSIAQQLRVSTTPVRDALNRLEKDGLIVKLPYQGWFVRRFQEQEIREIYEMRAGLECFAGRLACERITPEEVEALRAYQAVGAAALAREDLEAYRLYNLDLHAAIVRAARNAELSTVMAQASRKTQMLSARTIRVLGRPRLAVQEHAELIELIGKHQTHKAQEAMERHIISAMEDIFRHGLR